MKQWHDKYEAHTNVAVVDTVNFPKCGTLNIINNNSTKTGRLWYYNAGVCPLDVNLSIWNSLSCICTVYYFKMGTSDCGCKQITFHTFRG